MTFLTPRQVAERWGCSPRHVRRLCASGELRAMRLGIDAWRISLEAVEAYEAAQTSGPVPSTSHERPTPEPIATAAEGVVLPADYEPVFPALWGMAPEEAAQPAARRGGSAQRKAPVRRNRRALTCRAARPGEEYS